MSEVCLLYSGLLSHSLSMADRSGEHDVKGNDGSLSMLDVMRRTAALCLSALLIQACASGDVVAVANLICEGRVDPSVTIDGSGRTALSVACGEGHIAVVRHLIEKEGVSPLLRGAGWSTPLHAAVKGGHIEVVKYLIEEGVNPSCEDEDGVTALDCTTDVKMKDLLLNHGARLSKVSTKLKVGHNTVHYVL